MNMKATVLSFLVLTGTLATGAIAQSPAFSEYKTLPVNGITMAYRDMAQPI